MMTIFDVIADPTRRIILDLLRDRPRIVSELVAELEISQPGVSKQLRILREADLVTVQQEGRKRLYVLTPKPLSELDQWLANYRQLWEDRYDRLDVYLEEIKQSEKEDSNDNTE
ncbi:MAG: metalloregulator ArsR/SmtB family transcription factor [Chloroflexota bacterium]